MRYWIISVLCFLGSSAFAADPDTEKQPVNPFDTTTTTTTETTESTETTETQSSPNVNATVQKKQKTQTVKPQVEYPEDKEYEEAIIRISTEISRKALEIEAKQLEINSYIYPPNKAPLE